MRAAQIIEEVLLLERVNIDRGPIGIELELLVRRDVHSSKHFKALLADVGWSHSTDQSIDRSPWSHDVYYLRFETNNDPPAAWSKVKPGLTALTAWLKREDVVEVSRKGDNVNPKGYFKHNPDAGRTLKLPRGKMPSNASTGLHIHFDVAAWFDGPEHAATFVKMFNRHGEDIYKPSVLKSRYSDGFERGNQYAPFKHMKELHPKSLPATKPWRGGTPDQSAVTYFHFAKVMDKFPAVNCKSTLNRGDVEFRFMHGTLNINTIEGWLFALAELIEFSRTYRVPHDGGWQASVARSRKDFDAYLDKENPEAKQFLKTSAERMAKGQIEPDPLTTRVKPPKVSRSLVRRLKDLNAIDSRKDLEPQTLPRKLRAHVDKFSR